MTIFSADWKHRNELDEIRNTDPSNIFYLSKHVRARQLPKRKMTEYVDLTECLDYPLQLGLTMTFRGMEDHCPENGKQGDIIVMNDGSMWLYTGTTWEIIEMLPELRQSYEPRTEQEFEVPTNCCNCGAPLRGHLQCEYCRTTNMKKY